jgi:hypothetical protein
MAIRLRYKWSLAVSSSDAEENDLGNVKYEVVSDANNEGGIWKTTVAGGATVPLNLDNIASAKLVMMRFTPKDPTQTMTPIVVTLNGSIVLPAITPVGDMDEALLVLTTQGITSVSVANTDVAAVAIDIAVGAAGD